MQIATRTFVLRRPSGDRQIAVRLDMPEQGSDGSWSCRYEIDWPHGLWSHAAQAVDPVQAVVLALQMIGSGIYASEYHKSREPVFESPGRGYGFSVPANLRDLLVGDDAKYL